MGRYKLLLSYDGTPFPGWQAQSGRKGIQPLVQQALETILRHPIQLTGAGRTDAGVHAKGQTAHFDSDASFEPPRLLLSLNALLPPEVRALALESVPPTFHARYSATAKVYEYRLRLAPTHDPLRYKEEWHIPFPLDLDAMRRAAAHLVGTHNFSSFANQPDQGSAKRNPVRTLSAIEIAAQGPHLSIRFTGSGFLYKMVRNLTGALIEVGRGALLPDAIPLILAAQDRRRAPQSAPAHGLHLLAVQYTSR
jgi:tRNA pseudouridine38-40 synthase